MSDIYIKMENLIVQKDKQLREQAKQIKELQAENQRLREVLKYQKDSMSVTIHCEVVDCECKEINEAHKILKAKCEQALKGGE